MKDHTSPEDASDESNHPLTVQQRLDALAKDYRWMRDQAMIEARSCASDDTVTRALIVSNAKKLNRQWVRQQSLPRVELSHGRA